jgi:hypothetical protein
VLCGLFLSLLLAAPSLAQTSQVSAALDGTVSDSSGARTPHVMVMVRDAATNQRRQVPTNAEGAFQVAKLSPGTYEVSVSEAGFASYKHTGLVLALRSTTHLDVVLRPAGATTQITVSAQPLLNRGNVAQINPVFGSGLTPLSSFLQPLTGAGARRLQFSLDFEF